jgi:hypothetical protein
MRRNLTKPKPINTTLEIGKPSDRSQFISLVADPRHPMGVAAFRVSALHK